jgi:hypothetical protein
MSPSQGRRVPAPTSTLFAEKPWLLKSDSFPPAATHPSAVIGICPPLAKITAVFESSPNPTSQNAGTRRFSRKNPISIR